MTELSTLGNKLAAAIQAGDAKEAANLVAKLSEMKLKLDISIKNGDQEQRSNEQEFSVRVHVEDRVSDGCFINLQVKSGDTIQDLKKKVMLQYNFPEEVQRWIIGKKIPDNENKLSQCGVKGPGHTLYLYLVTARSVGLSKQEYESKRQALQQGVASPVKQQSQSGSPSPVQRESPEQCGPMSPQETQSNSCSGSTSPVLAPSPVLALGEVDPGQMTYGLSKQTSKKSLSSGSSLLHEMLMYPNLSSLAASDSHPRPATQNTAGNDVGHWASVLDSNQIRSTFSTPTPPKNEKIGWECPLCTYINLPVRPGCEMCAGPRPQDYKIPFNYSMTPEEILLLQNDKRLEKMTREAETSSMPSYQVPDFYDQHRGLQHNQILNVHSNNNSNPWDSSSNYPIIDDEFDWDNIQEVTLSSSPNFETEVPPHHHQSHRRQSLRRNMPVAAPPPHPNLLMPQQNPQAPRRNAYAQLINYSNQTSPIATQNEFSEDVYISDEGD